MPMQTPSPHRFLAAKASSTQKANAKPQSSLRHGSTAHSPKPNASLRDAASHPSNVRKENSARRFVFTATQPLNGEPRTGKARFDEERAEAPTHSTPFPRTRRKVGRVESIEEGPQESIPNFTNVNEQYGIAQSVERSPLLFNQNHWQGESEDEEMLFILKEGNKRRRATPQPPSSPSAHRTIESKASEPQTPAPVSHRFRVPAQRTPSVHSNTTMTATAHSHRPQFILPTQPNSPPKPMPPLPETFSPSRKNQKHVPGGLASTLQTWMVETANIGFASSNWVPGVVWGRNKEDGVKLRVRVLELHGGRNEVNDALGDREVECSPGSVLFAQGDTEPGLYNASRAPNVADEKVGLRLLLSGQGAVRGSGGVKIRQGSVVGIRAPMWDINVGKETWVVGVDWVVL